MKKKLVMLLTALMLVGATTTAFAAPSPEVDSPEIDSPGASDDFEAGVDVSDIEDMTKEELEEVANALVGELTTSNVVVNNGTVTDIKAVAVEVLEAVVEQVEELAEINDLEVDAFTVLAAMDIEVNAEGAVTISVPLAVEEGKSVVVLHEYEAGKWERIADVDVADGMVTFTLESFSPVVILTVDADAVKTGVVSVLPMIALAGLAGAAVCGKKSR